HIVDHSNAIVDQVCVNVDIYLEVFRVHVGLAVYKYRQVINVQNNKHRVKYGTLRNTTLNTQPIGFYITYLYTLPSTRQITS
ncbi:hypothetical protein J6590_102539, partial [Homalodisca vitripennis]